jgi:hypothetical protein
MFKLIPHIADGSWVIKQSVGTTPVLLGNKLQTKYFRCGGAQGCAAQRLPPGARPLL